MVGDSGKKKLNFFGLWSKHGDFNVSSSFEYVRLSSIIQCPHLSVVGSRILDIIKEIVTLVFILSWWYKYQLSGKRNIY